MIYPGEESDWRLRAPNLDERDKIILQWKDIQVTPGKQMLYPLFLILAKIPVAESAGNSLR